ncbi:RNA polymerase sigma factor [Hymenobacter radiodurans]|uniref:RNA polymerase sigma factor n=1 Tax=Hymenobacter radiodurans TaxID=2496028 RepID=UPI001058760B|nr:RNA polymerase sigma factor [Hymenobacter radiodurans]
MSQPDHDSALLTALLAGCRRADRECQRRLYGQYYSLAMSVCLRYLRNREQAMEAVNDGFLKVFRDADRFDVRLHLDIAGSFRAWLRKIMVHTAIDHFRIAEKHAFQQTLDEVAALHPDPGVSALDTLSFDELVALVHGLPAAYRAVFNLYAIDGFTHEEIAEQLGISAGTSKSNLFKARAHLKHLLKKIKHHAYARHVG